ncbi:MAG: LysR family transcriptional regulator [Gammaproteobacteria bacterium]|nr:LysR family transcriptional regulator [Gammaproteobacteria bacterium]NNC97749.1 LysR family transcriptional regulator [Gammaproteobacteria bacterium]NNM13258.1 LysR family transcriptional regulator [Gammaproteobacteria bacterium]
MKLRELEYLLAVAETGHFGQAAEKCFVSQPTLSAGIKKLEQELEIVLFERDNRSVTLTPAGVDVRSMAKSIMHKVDEINDYANYHKDPFAGQFKMAAIPTIAPYFFPLVMENLKQELPKLEWRLYEYQTENLLQALRDGDTDIGLLATRESHKHFVQVPLFSEDFVLVMAKGHALKGKRNLRSADLEHAKMLLLSEGHCLRDQALDVCTSKGIAASDDYKATSLETLRQMVVAGAGVTLLPQLALREAHQRTGLDLRIMPKPKPRRTVYLTWRRNFYRLPLIGKITECLQQRVEDLKL